MVAGADEAAVALEQRQLVAERLRRDARPALGGSACDGGQRCRQFRRAAAVSPKQIGDRARCLETGAQRAEVARAAAVERQPATARAACRRRSSGSPARASAQLRARTGRRRPQSSLAPIAAGSVSGAISRSASSRAPAAGHRAVDRLEQRAVAAAGQRAQQFQIGARRRVDEQRRAVLLALGPRQRRPFGLLRLLDIGDGAGDRRQFGARERAETVRRRDLEEAGDAPRGRRRIEQASAAADWRRGRARRTAASVPDRRTPARRRSARAGRRGRYRPAAGRPWFRRRGKRRSRCRSRRAQSCLVRRCALPPLARPTLDPPQRHQEFDSDGASSLSSVMVPGVTRRTTSRLHHRFAAALLGLGRILDLLADGDAEALARSASADSRRRHAPARRTSGCRGPDACRAWSARCRAPGLPSRRRRRTARRNRPCGRTAANPGSPP